MLKSLSLENRIIVITGGYGHLGRAIVYGLVQAGAKVWVLGRSHEKFLKTFGLNDSTVNQQIAFLQATVESSDSINQAFSQVLEQESRIDALINNAFYVGSPGQPEALEDESWNRSIDGCLHSVYRCIRAIIPHFRRNSGGKIINVSSMYGVVAPDFSVYEEAPAFLNPPHYGAAKAGVVQLTRYFAQYLGPERIQVNCISPGPFPSEAVQKNQAFVERLKQQTALKRIGQPEDLQGAFVLLCSEASDYITGQNLLIDGGWTIH